jgi:hypothetical protein
MPTSTAATNFSERGISSLGLSDCSSMFPTIRLALPTFAMLKRNVLSELFDEMFVRSDDG